MGAMGLNPVAVGTTGSTGSAGVSPVPAVTGSAGVSPVPVGSGSASTTVVAGDTPALPDSSRVLNPAPIGGGALPGATGGAGGSGYTPDIPRLVKRVAAATGVSPTLISAVIKAESGGDPHAISPAGAKGLMQLMDATAATYGVTNAFDPMQNLTAGATYLST